MKLTISIEYAHDEELPDITVEQVKKALQKFIVPSRSLHIYLAVEHRVQSDGAGTLPESGEYFVEYVESNIVRLTPRR